PVPVRTSQAWLRRFNSAFASRPCGRPPRVAGIAAMQRSLKPQRCLRTAFKAAPWRATILRLESERARGFQAKDVLHRLGEGGLFSTGIPSYGWQAVFYTYVIESLSHPDQCYIGHTANLRQRLVDHNARKCPHTSKFVPWKLKVYVAFETIEQAQHFER